MAENDFHQNRLFFGENANIQPCDNQSIQRSEIAWASHDVSFLELIGLHMPSYQCDPPFNMKIIIL